MPNDRPSDKMPSSLESLLAKGRLDVRRCLRIACSLAEALAVTHASGTACLTLRPAGILVDEQDDTASLPNPDSGMDAGAASAQFNSSDSAWAYLSPEQTGRMNRAVDYRADFYALGIILFRMLTGSLPFRADDPLEWMHCHVARVPLAPVHVASGIPRMLSDIVMKLLEKDADERYQSAPGLKKDLSRCLEEWDRSGRVEAFRLGEHDVFWRFRLPERLYGRDVQLAAMVRAFELMTESGRSGTLLLSGPAGIGKSFLVHELQRSIVGRHGIFVSAKFDQYQRDSPYHAIARAFRDFIQQLLGESESGRVAWRERLLEALENNGQLIVDLVPRLALVIGPQPAVPPLPPAEAQRRLHRVFGSFLKVIAGTGRPLVLFFDDLQWADAGSLALIENVAQRREARYVMMICAYREEEVTDGHPLLRVIEGIRADGDATDIHLAPLDAPALQDMIADALHCGRLAAMPLAMIMHRKTRGNPFFVRQLLRTLYESGLILFDHHLGGWQWDLDRINQESVADNVVELMTAEFERIPAGTRDVLKLAACRGVRFDASELALLAGSSIAEIASALQPALDKGLILVVQAAPLGGHGEHSFRWSHDRVQQAAYMAILPDELPYLHLRIGRILLAASSTPEPENLFDIVDHLNAGACLICGREERMRLAELDLAAGRRAKAAIAYAAALRYLSAGIELTGDDWVQEYRLGFSLRLERVECEQYAGNLEQAARLAEELEPKARENRDRIEVCRIRMMLHFVLGHGIAAAVEEEMKGLAICGMALPRNPTREDVIVAVDRIAQLLGDRPVETIVDLPAMTDAQWDVLTMLTSASIYVNWYLGGLRIANMVALAIEHGNNDMAVFWYSTYAVSVLAPVVGDYPQAHRFARAASQLARKRGVLMQKPQAGFCLGLTSFWMEPVDQAIALFDTAFADAAEISDFHMGCFAACSAVLGRLVRGDPLSEMRELTERAAEFARRSRSPDWIAIAGVIRQFVRNLLGETHDPHTFSNAEFDQDEFESTLASPRWHMVPLQYGALRLRAYFLSGDYRLALAAAERVGPHLGKSSCHIALRDYYVYYPLTLAILVHEESEARQAAWLDVLKQCQEQIRYWAALNPRGFGHLDALMSAEIARIGNRTLEAARFYEESIKGARESRLVPDQALVYERAARFYGANGFDAFGELYLSRARGCYARWGAAGKVRQLDEEYPQLAPRSSFAPNAGLAVDVDQQLDLLSIVKTSQAISGEIELDALLDTVMRTVIENAGAQQGALVLVRDTELSLAVRAGMGEQGLGVKLGPEEVEPGHGVPRSIANYVRNSRERVLLDDAGESNPFASDPYFAGKGARSVLCLPILRQGEVTGLLYLENNLVTHAFTPERLSVLELLAAQAAIALENAQFVTTLQRENLERKRAEEAVREREARIRRLVEANIIGIIFWDISGHVGEANDAFLRMAGYTRDDLHAGRIDWFLMTPPEWRDADRRAAAELRSSGTCTPYEKECVRKDGSRVPILVGAAMIDGAPDSGIAFVLDLTERRQAEAERAARKIADEANAAKSAFVANMSHELRSPLNTMLGFGRLIERQSSLPAEVREDLGIMLRSGEHLRVMINQVLDLAKIEAGRSTLNETSFDLHYLLGELEDMCALKAREKGVALRFFRDNAPQLIRADPVKLRQVLINLLGNALKFTEQGKVTLRVSLIVREDAFRLQFQVADTGVGIAPEELPQLFGAFTQAEAGRKAREGTGLGLTISRNFVRLMGGELRIDSVPQKGTTVSFDIPLQEASAAEVAPVRRRHAVALLNEGLQERYRILVVDDHSEARQLLVRLLSPLGFELREAVNGQEAIDIWRAWRPRLIWMDMRMPVLDGLNATRRIKASRGGRSTIIIALTASSFEEERNEILNAGCDGFLRKPFHEEELCGLMEMHLGIRFRYEEEARAVPETSEALHQSALAALPESVRAALEEALVRLDPAAVAAAIAQIDDAPLAEALTSLAQAFQYSRILNLIQAGEEEEEEGDEA